MTHDTRSPESARLSPSRVAEIRDQNEHDRRGLRFAQGQRMAATIDDLLAERDRVSDLLRTPEVRELVQRLRELAKAVTEGPEAVRREFTMRIPAEPNRDADLVLSQAADLLAALGAEGTDHE